MAFLYDCENFLTIIIIFFLMILAVSVMKRLFSRGKHLIDFLFCFQNHIELRALNVDILTGFLHRNYSCAYTA
jgi:hypothetical protein